MPNLVKQFSTSIRQDCHGARLEVCRMIRPSRLSADMRPNRNGITSPMGTRMMVDYEIFPVVAGRTRPLAIPDTEQI